MKLRISNNLLIFTCAISFTFAWIFSIEQDLSKWFVVVLLLLGSFASVIIKPQSIYYLYFASFFIGFPVIINFHPLRFYLSDFLLIPLLFFVFSGYYSTKSRGSNVFRVNKVIPILLSLQFIIAILSFLFNFQNQTLRLIQTSLWGAFRFIHMMIVFIIFSRSNFKFNYKLLFIIFFLLTLLQIPASILGNFQSGDITSRFTRGTFGGHHACLGTFMAITFYFGFAFFLQCKYHFHKLLSIILMLVSFILMLTSESRSILFGMIFSLIVLFLTKFKIQIKYMLYGGIILLLSFITIYLTPLSNVFSRTFNQAGTGLDISSLSRPVIWHDSFLYFKKLGVLKKLFGHGIEFSRSSLEVTFLHGGDRMIPSAHNNYLTALVETGVFGFWTFIIIHTYTLLLLWKKYRKENDLNAYSFLLLHIAFLFANIGQDTFWVQGFVITSFTAYYAFLGYILSRSNNLKKTNVLRI